MTDAATDERTQNHPFVTGSVGVRFYAGVPLATVDGLIVGTLWRTGYAASRT